MKKSHLMVIVGVKLANTNGEFFDEQACIIDILNQLSLSAGIIDIGAGVHLELLSTEDYTVDFPEVLGYGYCFKLELVNPCEAEGVFVVVNRIQRWIDVLRDSSPQVKTKTFIYSHYTN